MKISARFLDFNEDFCKISRSARFPDSSVDIDILILNFSILTVYRQEVTLSAKGVASESTYIIGIYNIYSMYNSYSKSLLQRRVSRLLVQISDFEISNHVITKKRSYADLDYKIT